MQTSWTSWWRSRPVKIHRKDTQISWGTSESLWYGKKPVSFSVRLRIPAFVNHCPWWMAWPSYSCLWVFRAPVNDLSPICLWVTPINLLIHYGLWDCYFTFISTLLTVYSLLCYISTRKKMTDDISRHVWEDKQQAEKTRFLWKFKGEESFSWK